MPAILNELNRAAFFEPRDVNKLLEITQDQVRDWRRRFPDLMAGIGEQESGRWRYRPHHFIELAIVCELRSAGIDISYALQIADHAHLHVLSWLSFDTLDRANREFSYIVAWEVKKGKLAFDDLRDLSKIQNFERPIAFLIDHFQIAKAIEPRVTDKKRQSKSR
jgi:MerR HTH family regulatory protein